VANGEALLSKHDDYEDVLKWALERVSCKREPILRRRRYSDGQQPRTWLTKKVRKMFDQKLQQSMIENWIELVVEAPLSRTRVTRIVGDSDMVTTAAQEMWKQNKMPRRQVELWRKVYRDGEAFAVRWHEDEPTGFESISTPDALTIAWPDEEDLLPDGTPEYFARVWIDRKENIFRATIYYDTDVVRFIGPAPRDSQNALPGFREFQIDPEEPGGPHGFKRPPGQRFALREDGKSRIDTCIPPQDKINKLVMNKMVNAEFNAFAQLIALTNQPIEDGDLERSPDKVLSMSAGDGGPDGWKASLFETTPTILANYDDSIAQERHKLFAMATLPKHLEINPGTPPSGDAVEADEGPFTEMVGNNSDILGDQLAELFELDDLEVTVEWRNPKNVSETEQAATVTSMKAAGVPLDIALKRYADWTDEEVEELQNAPLTPQALMGHLGQLGQAAALGAIGPDQHTALANHFISRAAVAMPGQAPDGGPAPSPQPPPGSPAAAGKR
jgi:hypothetical protein